MRAVIPALDAIQIDASIVSVSSATIRCADDRAIPRVSSAERTASSAVSCVSATRASTVG